MYKPLVQSDPEMSNRNRSLSSASRRPSVSQVQNTVVTPSPLRAQQFAGTPQPQTQQADYPLLGNQNQEPPTPVSAMSAPHQANYAQPNTQNNESPTGLVSAMSNRSNYPPPNNQTQEIYPQPSMSNMGPSPIMTNQHQNQNQIQEGVPPMPPLPNPALVVPSNANTPAPSTTYMPPRPQAISRLSAEMVPPASSPVRRYGTGGNEMTYWNPPPQVQPRYQPSYQDMHHEMYHDSHHPIPSTEPMYDLGLTPTATYSHRPWPSQDQGRHSQEHSRQDAIRRQKSGSMRSLRFDPKRHSYHFDALSDIESMSGMPSREQRRSSLTRLRREQTPPDEILRLPLTWWMNSNAKNHFVATIGEFIGTTMFLFFAYGGTEVANIQSGPTTSTNNGFSPIVLLYISTSFGFSLMVNVWIFFRISGGLFNPAVTLGMFMVKSVSFLRAMLLVIAQLCGSMLASVLVRAVLPTTFNTRTTLRNDTSLARGVFIEAILTAELVFTIFMLAKEKHKATFMAPIGIGFALFIAELTGVYYTGGSLNPARSFGPCVINGVWDKEHWIYWVGPAIGAVLAVCFYRFIKILEYEVANPGQDAKNETESRVDKEVLTRQYTGTNNNALLRSQTRVGKEETPEHQA